MQVQSNVYCVKPVNMACLSSQVKLHGLELFSIILLLDACPR